MRAKWLGLIVALAVAGVAVTALRAEDEKAEKGDSVLSKVKWEKGETTSKLGSLAEIKVPAGFMFANGNDTRLLMEAMENPATDAELGLVAPTSFAWFVVFEFSDVGYVKDDEKGKLDADAMLKSLQKGTEAGNKERRKRGWAPLTIVGWKQPPQYDPETQNLTWATLLRSGEGENVNYNTRLLGRKGVMSVTLVLGADQMDTVVPEFKQMLKGFSYVAGERYAEYRAGDKIAKYGLTALVVGGGAALAAKAGLFKHLWKIIVVAGAAIAGFVKKLFGRKSE